MFSQSLSGEWSFRRAGEAHWLPGRVPGCVHTDLLRNGLIPDPFIGDQEKQAQWVAECDWEYRRSFDLSAPAANQERLFLVCDGLDTLAEVSLNGAILGQTDNMFRQYRWEISTVIQPGTNELVITFRSPVRTIARLQSKRPLPGVPQAIPGFSYLRKAACQFGWDWGPKLPPVGIWKDLRIEGYSTARLEDVHLRQRHSAGEVTLVASVAVERWSRCALTALLRLTAPSGSRQETRIELPVGALSRQGSIKIQQPQLWWPNGYGEQPLYQVDVYLYEGNQQLDRRTTQTGLRTVELHQAPDEWGKSFTFVVNGIPIFAKGSNWIPADSFPTRITAERLEFLLRSAAETHQNMLRVWGGGYYEDERFYDLCDRYGLLIWQDLMFACAVYPLNQGAFLDSVRLEVAENVRRLRHHACLALWCGNNEMEWEWETWGWALPWNAGLKKAYDRFFHHTLPGWIAAEDTDHEYWPSSPSSQTPFRHSNGQQQGDSHYWEVWHLRMPFSAYHKQFPRFMSEFGFQSLPPPETIRSFAGPDSFSLRSAVLKHHQRSRSGNEHILRQINKYFRPPKDFPSQVYLSMVLQAEGIRYGVEHWRRNRKRVSGTLYWQLNDCWPAVSWSSLDYYGRWKALHYAARRFYAPLLLSLEENGKQVAVHVTNDRRESWQGELHWVLETLGGEAICSGQQAVTVEAGDSIQVFSDEMPVPEGKEGDLIFLCDLVQNGLRVASNLTPFVPNKDLKLEDPQLTVEVEQEGQDLIFVLSTHSLARFVELELEGVDVVFSDNYFDLHADRTAQVSCLLLEGWGVEEARRVVRVRSLYNSFI